MDWRLKALVQKAAAALPEAAGRPFYYALQRHFGSLCHIDPRSRLRKGTFFASTTRRLGHSLEDRTVVEVGTGWTLDIPISLWLLGAGRVVTADVNRYLREPLVLESLQWIQRHPGRVASLFGSLAEHPIFKERLAQLEAVERDVEALCQLAGIRYLAPVDTANLPLPSGNAALHYSTNVLEHVAPRDLRPLFQEARRLLATDGLTIHRIDLSDHFAHADPSISTVHFLRFDERQWQFWAGNRFAYHNRLRVNDFEALFEQVGLSLLSRRTSIDQDGLERLRGSMPLAFRFSRYPPEALATSFMEMAGAFSYSPV